MRLCSLLCHVVSIFCCGRVFRGYLKKAPRVDERRIWGSYSWGPWGESSERIFFFYQAALLSRLVAINTCHRYPGLDCTADQLVLALNLTSCSSSTLSWLLLFHDMVRLPPPQKKGAQVNSMSAWKQHLFIFGKKFDTTLTSSSCINYDRSNGGG